MTPFLPSEGTIAAWRPRAGHLGTKTLAGRQVPVSFALPGDPLLLGGPVVTGFGRGSRQMGVPTANIDPAPLQGALADMPLGVYFGRAWSYLCSHHARVGFLKI